MTLTTSTTHHTALIYVMVLVAGSDGGMPNSELRSIGEVVQYLPIFRDYDRDRLTKDAAACGRLLNDDDGLENVLDQVEAALPERLRETAYALACDVAAADGRVTQEEARMLDIIRYRLQVGRLAAAAIERGARARHMTI
ncbi:tellurite resistance protein [Constrictibacter sp. MBR-5]|jgi:tellurite resistance protein|uniref:tellurite resistance TerB family protein n=1 Tax=Constrictibacter sp. MBR-5 TaxID=3156467 RepID=UPI0033997400